MTIFVLLLIFFKEAKSWFAKRFSEYHMPKERTYSDHDTSCCTFTQTHGGGTFGNNVDTRGCIYKVR